MPSSYRKKLIEVALPLEDINLASVREKSIRHGHPSTLHLWWARQPHAACRAVLFASLVDDPSECVPELMKDAAKRKAAEQACREQHPAWGKRKAVFDKAEAAGLTGPANPPPGVEPTVADIIANQERERLFDLIRQLVTWENTNNPEVLAAAQAEIMRSTGGQPPPVYDPFCGGGSIPLEAQRLGLEAYASDLNPVPVLINKALIEIPPAVAGLPPVNPASRTKMGASGSWKRAAGLAEDIRYYGKWMRDEAERRLGQLYPPVHAVQEADGAWRHATPEEIASGKKSVQRLTVIAWLWTRTIASPDPAARGAHIPMAKSFWLARKPGKKAWVEPVPTDLPGDERPWHFVVRTELVTKTDGPAMEGTVSRTGAVCILTGSPIPLTYARTEAQAGRMGARMMAIACEGTRGRIYLPPNPEHEAAAAVAIPEGVPDTEISKTSLGFNVMNYGLRKHAQLFSPRQLHGMMGLSELVAEARDRAMEDGANEAYAKAISIHLAFVVGRLSQQFSTLCPWSSHPVHELVITMFGRQTLAMPWDYGEINPFCEAASWMKCCDFVAKVVEASLGENPLGKATTDDADDALDKLSAGGLVFTGPPYYDNIGYADLGDYFYIWLRISLRAFMPELFATMLTPKETEMIANRHRFGGSTEQAMGYFESRLRGTLQRIAQKQHKDYPLAIYYTYKQEEVESEGNISFEDGTKVTGWEVMLSMLLDVGLVVTGTWPMRTQRGGGLKASINALASSIVLVCRPRARDAEVVSRRDFQAGLKQELPEALRNLQKGNIAPVDLAQAAIGPGMAVFSRYAKVLETDGSPMTVRMALSLINQSLDEVLAEQEGEFDADTRWALAWFDQYGFGEGPYGQAETLSTAKNTSVSGMEEAGILSAKGGKVRLLRKEELPADWDPTQDERLTIWEATHSLSRAQAEGEIVAAALLQKLGPAAEVARDLGYRLYSVCERRKWAQEALGYNALVLAWPEISRLARERREGAAPRQSELGL